MTESDADIWPRMLTRLASRQALDADEAAEAMRSIMDGEATARMALAPAKLPMTGHDPGCARIAMAVPPASRLAET